MEANIRYQLSPALIERIQSLPEHSAILCNAPSGDTHLVESLTAHLRQLTLPSAGISVHLPTDADHCWPDSTLENINQRPSLLLIYAELTSDGAEEQVQLTFSKEYSAAEIAELSSRKNAIRRLYTRCYITSDLSAPEPAINLSSEEQTENSETPAAVLREAEQLTQTHCLSSNESLALLLFQGQESPAMLEQIGRGRAITFAAIGAGTGSDIDLSPEDQYYHHLALWDKKADTLVGAYRIGLTKTIIHEHGKSGLYLDHIFDAQPEFYDQLGNAMELSRSYILPSYQKNPQMLDALWKGVGLTATAKQCFTMYGSVTISAAFTPLSQAILVDSLDRYHSDSESLRNSVRSKAPFIASTVQHKRIADAWAEQGMSRLNSIIEEIEQEQRSIPPLVKYYVALGAKFSAFQVEPSFNNAIYCLLRVDLQTLPPRYKKRFLGGVLS